MENWRKYVNELTAAQQKKFDTLDFEEEDEPVKPINMQQTKKDNDKQLGSDSPTVDPPSERLTKDKEIKCAEDEACFRKHIEPMYSQGKRFSTATGTKLSDLIGIAFKNGIEVSRESKRKRAEVVLGPNSVYGVKTRKAAAPIGQKAVPPAVPTHTNPQIKRVVDKKKEVAMDHVERLEQLDDELDNINDAEALKRLKQITKV